MKKKITIIHHCGLIGGAGVSLLEISKMLKDEFELEVWCTNTPIDMVNLLRENNITVEEYDFLIGSVPYYSGGPKVISRTFGLSLINIKKYKSFWKEKIKNSDSDLILVNSIILCWFGKLIKSQGKKAICFVRETIPNNRNKIIYNFINNCFKSYFDAVYFISNYDKDIFSNVKKKSFVIKDNLKDEFFLPLEQLKYYKLFNIDVNRFNILFVGGMSKLKGTHVIIDAMKYLSKDINLIIAGYYLKEDEISYRNSYEKYIYKLIKGTDIKNQVNFIGVQKDIIPIYNICDILVFPSTKAHQARPVFEAGACEKAVIVSDFIEIHETVKNYKNGLLFKANDSKDLAGKIKILYNDRQLCYKLGVENKIMSIKNHSISAVKNELLNATRKVIEE